jgi:hypothetical protein
MNAIRRLAAFVAAMPLALRVVLALALVLHGVGLSWGMPASDGWDVDGVAPRDVLPGLAETFTPGHFYTYPPLQLVLLAILTLPVSLAALVHAPSTSLPDLVREILAAPYMTAIAMTARVVSALMSVGIVYALARIAEELAPDARKREVLVGTAIVTAIDAPFTYYAHVTNLDVPYLFWASLAALALVRAIVRREPRRLRSFAVLAALAIATKDQAYAMFLVAAPLLVGAWIAVDRARTRTIAKELAIGAGIAIAILLLVDGAITNPSGFRARLAFLGGSASQDFATYSRDLAGRVSVLADTGKLFERHYPSAVLVLVAIGIVDAVLGARARGRNVVVAALAPLAIGLSFELCFNLVARRVEERFTLPQALTLAIYAGFGVARLWTLGAGPLRWAGRAVAVAIAGVATWHAMQVDATLLAEPRYDAEAWVREHARPEDTIEVHGLNVYLARFSGVRVTRVDPLPARNPMPGVEEIEAPLSAVASRSPRFIAVNECYVWRYLERDLAGSEGRIVPSTQRTAATDPDATAFFQGLFHGRLGYHLAHESRIKSELFPRYHLHASLGCPMFVFEKN